MYAFKQFQNTELSLSGFQSFEKVVSKSLIGIVDPEAWVCLKSGNWSDPSIWQKNGSQTRSVPNSNFANVVVNKGVTLTVNQSATINNLDNYGVLNLTDSTNIWVLTINNRCNIQGVLNMTNISFNSLILNGLNNYINPLLFISGGSSSQSRIVYGRIGRQDVLNLLYSNLSIAQIVNQPSIKKLTSNIVVTNLTGNITNSSLYISQAILDLNGFNLTTENVYFSGSSFTNVVINSGGTCNLVCNQTWAVGGNDPINIGLASLEFKGNIIQGGASSGTITYTAANFYFNTLSYTASRNLTFSGACLIISACTFTNLAAANFSIIIATSINGSNASSTFDNRGLLSITTTTDVMTTGIFNANQAANTVTYGASGNQNIRTPNDGAYRDLVFSGSGVKTLTGNITCTNLTISGTATIAFAGFTITVTGNLTYNSSIAENIHTTSQIIHTTDLFFTSVASIKTLTSNRTCSNFSLYGNQAINFNGYTLTVTGQVLWESSGALNIPNSSTLIHTGVFVLQGHLRTYTLTGNRTCSDWIMNLGDCTIIFAGFTLTSTTTQYVWGGSQKVCGTANNPLTNLTLGGTATPNNKTLQGNVSVPATYSVTGNAVKVDNGFVFGNP